MSKEAFESVVDNIAARVPKTAAGETIGADGLTHCNKCGKATQVKITLFGKTKIVPCICQCEKDRMEQDEQQRQQEEQRRQLENMKSTGFTDRQMKLWTFENDNGNAPKIMQAMKNYCEHWRELKQDGRGLLLYGNVGTGKTYAAACVANRLMEQGTPVLMTNFTRIINKLQSTFDGRQEYIDGLNRFDLLILDDLAAERNTEYMQETVYNIIDARYRANKPLIVTTNLTMDELKNPQSVTQARIYDRILEKCFPVKIEGASQRRKKIASEYNGMKELLGL